MIVHVAPATTCRNISGHFSSTAIATTRSTTTAATIGRPARGTISKSGICGAGCRSASATAPCGETATSAIAANLTRRRTECERSGRRSATRVRLCPGEQRHRRRRPAAPTATPRSRAPARGRGRTRQGPPTPAAPPCARPWRPSTCPMHHTPPISSTTPPSGREPVPAATAYPAISEPAAIGAVGIGRTRSHYRRREFGRIAEYLRRRSTDAPPAGRT